MNSKSHRSAVEYLPVREPKKARWEIGVTGLTEPTAVLGVDATDRETARPVVSGVGKLVYNL